MTTKANHWALGLCLCLAGCGSDGATSASRDSGLADRTGHDVSSRRDSGPPGDERDAGSSDVRAHPTEAGLGDVASGRDGEAGAFMEAKHAPFPQVPNGGGPILAVPKLVTVSFAGYQYGPTVPMFGDWIVTSSWLSTVGQDYGVGAGVHIANVVLPGPAPATASDLDTQAMLETNLQNGTLPAPSGVDGGAAADGGTGPYLYMVFYPSSTQVGGFLDGGDTCADLGGGQFIGGYHWETQSGPFHVPYAVLPTCTGGGLTEKLSDEEVSASHEFIEASTDPFPYTNTAFALTDPSSPWTYLDGEVADLCEGETIQVSGYSAQRVWSNTAAMAGDNPCIPASTTPFFGASPSPTLTQSVNPGSTVTYTVTGFSAAPMAAWSIYALVGYATFTPTVTLSSMTLGNGQTATLTVKVPLTAMSGDFASVLVSSYTGPTDLTYWPVAVTVQ